MSRERSDGITDRGNTGQKDAIVSTPQVETVSWYPRYLLGLLVVVYAFNFIDLQILSILLKSIRADLDLNDTQLGFLTGISFALFYSMLGIPIARLADRSSRSAVIAVCLAVWSFMTTLCGLAQNFWHLLFARIGVSVGEAGCSPEPSPTMLMTLLPVRRSELAGAAVELIPGNFRRYADGFGKQS